MDGEHRSLRLAGARHLTEKIDQVLPIGFRSHFLIRTEQ